MALHMTDMIGRGEECSGSSGWERQLCSGLLGRTHHAASSRSPFTVYVAAQKS